MHLFPVCCLVSLYSLKLATLVVFSRPVKLQNVQIVMSPLISEELVVNHIPDSTGVYDSLFDHFAIGWYWGYFQVFCYYKSYMMNNLVYTLFCGGMASG